MPQPNTPLSRATEIDAPQAEPADVVESRDIEFDSVIEDYLWVRRDEVLTVGGHRYFI